jgi:hypothetical protein
MTSRSRNIFKMRLLEMCDRDVLGWKAVGIPTVNLKSFKAWRFLYVPPGL